MIADQEPTPADLSYPAASRRATLPRGHQNVGPLARVTAAVTLLVALLTAGCSPSSSKPADGATPFSPSSSTPARKVFDPPTRFDTSGRPLGTAQPGDALLYDKLAFVAGPAALAVADITTGQQLTPLAPPHPAVADQVGTQPIAHTPLLVDLNGQPAIMAPYPVTVPATGTTTARPAVDLILADARTGQLLRTITVDTPASDSNPTGLLSTTLVGASDTVAVLRLNTSTVAIDLATGTTRWRATDFAAAAIVGDIVLGLTTPDSRYIQAVAGYSVTDGTKHFTGPKARYPALVPAGPSFAVLAGEQDNGNGFYALVDGDGRLHHHSTGSYGSRLRCWYDASSITVCAFSGTQLLIALDASSGADLWHLPATGRQAPDVTTVWHGAVYGTANGHPVVLDAHTGTDKQDSPGLAPVAVNGYAGIATGPYPGNLSVYPAIG